MSKSKPGKAAYRGNLTTFTKSIKGKVLENIEIMNERECRTMSLAFQEDSLGHPQSTSPWAADSSSATPTGDLEMIRRVGRAPYSMLVLSMV